MRYEKIVKAKFIERENRFVARVQVDSDAGSGSCSGIGSCPGTRAGDSNKPEICRVHVKNTGRCKELLVPDATVYLEDHINNMGSRKMRYSLVAVEKQIKEDNAKASASILINMDSQAPNKVVHEALINGKLKLPGFEIGGSEPIRKIEQRDLIVKPEFSYVNSRFDFYVELEKGNITKKALIEVKGVTLEENGFARFPDAPTERGLKHINELCNAVDDGYEAYIIFVIQMKKMHTFGPNYETQPEFGEALIKAREKGVHILAYDCVVTEDSLVLDQPVDIKLDQPVNIALE